MPADDRCDPVQDRLTDAAFEGTPLTEEDRRHVDGCEDCSSHRSDLAALTEALGAGTELPGDRAAAIRHRVALELAHSAPAVRPVATGAELPTGYRRELLRILAWAVAPLPLLLFVTVLLFQAGGALLSEFLPRLAVQALGAVAAMGAASWLALVYGSIPFVAHHKVSTRLHGSEVTP